MNTGTQGPEKRAELLRRLSPERRATYERIRKLREEIGPLDFDVVEELRKIREWHCTGSQHHRNMGDME